MKAEIKRDSAETQIALTLEYPGTDRDIVTNCGFMTHMIDLMCYRAGLGVTLVAHGDIEVDAHHLTEDLGIAFGKALKEIAKAGPIHRYGWALLPMDGSLARVALDFSGRGGAYWAGTFPSQKCGEFDTELVPEFLRALAREGGITLHADVIKADNSHHAAEAVFKGLGMALAAALVPADKNPSTKGIWL